MVPGRWLAHDWGWQGTWRLGSGYARVDLHGFSSLGLQVLRSRGAAVWLARRVYLGGVVLYLGV